MRKGLLISGYHSLSQASWADFIIEELTHIDWSMIALPPRYFSWRMRGNPLSIGQLAPELVTREYDVILATASVDLATIQSIYPALRNTSSTLYFHDNQFDYPAANNPQSVVDWQITHIYSAIRANKLLFNSQYNQDSFLNGVKRLMKKMPDLAPKKLPDELKKKSVILPVPIKPFPTQRTVRATNHLRVIWNHRWEWDKCPDLLEATVNILEASNASIEVIITGQEFRTKPENFERLQRKSTIVSHCAFVENESDYHALLSSCDIVLSTAIHEFQGIAVLEAVAAGCVPLLPNRLSYPEMYSSDYLYESNGNFEQQGQKIANKLKLWKEFGLPKAPDMSHFYRSNLKNDYKFEL
ncbi:DUF3524 domain-containing protein [Reinekea marina]|uniref:tRNA-queuosine alpha-mannosyltransferase n=1 Tax=Reinekea marina TaxID=1310421 RepID=A0ABV7WTR9_9GAMM